MISGMYEATSFEIYIIITTAGSSGMIDVQSSHQMLDILANTPAMVKISPQTFLSKHDYVLKPSSMHHPVCVK